ncbi:hypothetical protein [Wolbachia endosymbiont (group A) of Volucella inflata]|nr:hypothetical protein [Wolbachia endosymbiont (group A) of Volucella inflata]
MASLKFCPQSLDNLCEPFYKDIVQITTDFFRRLQLSFNRNKKLP